MGRACSTWKIRYVYSILGKELEGKDLLEDLDTDRRIALKWDLIK
jgi:hypothetical protein